MKKLLSLLSVLTISGTAVPTTIAASPYQKEENINNNINYSQTNNLENLNRNKRNFYEKEKIEFFNNSFFYKFNVDYDKEKSTTGAFDADSSVTIIDSITLIKNWRKYANSWEEFSTKFPEIELINFRSNIDNKNEIIKENFKIKNIKTKNSELSEIYINSFISRSYLSDYSHEWNKSANEFDNTINEFNNYSYKSFLCSKKGKILFRLYVDQQELKAQIIYILKTNTCSTSYKGRLKFDSIRLVGDIDVNPLLSLTTDKAKQFDNWASSKEKELKDKKEDPNYNKDHLLNEENSFKENFKLWLLQIRHDYIQDLINIGQNNEILNLKLEIDDLKSRLDKLEAPKTCLDNIFDSFKKNTLSSAPSDTWKSIKENSDSPLKIIVKKSGKAFATGLLTGVAKGSALGIISCVADFLL